MTKSIYISILFLWGSIVNATAQPVKKPNIILIMADDLGWGDVGFNGNKIIKTPSLDKMAAEGITFNRFYSASAVCSPTRASILTGRNPYRTGIFFANEGILRPEEITLPELLKDKGYLSGHFGKWHLGSLTDKETDANRGKIGNSAELNVPKQHGYDAAFVTESKVPTYDPMKKPANVKGLYWDYIKEGEAFKPFGTHYWDIDGNKVENNLEGDDSRVIMDRVLPFIDNAKNEKKPFLAVVWFHAPHLPCVAGPEYQQMYKDHDLKMRNYAGCITAMDEQIGRLRMYLKEQGMDENTMIWFCSDNGPEGNAKEPGSAGPFLGRKRSLHEGGIRVPGILVWPAVVKKPFITDVPCVTSDYLPTIADFLNISNKKLKNKIDGISLMPLLNQRMIKRSVPVQAVIRDEICLSDNVYKLYAKGDKFTLYNIVEDPTEASPITDKPEIVAIFKEKMLKTLKSYQQSFEGKEYGRASYDRLKQKWSDAKEGKDE